MYKGKDVKSFAETCRNASKAVTLLAVSFDDEDWQTFEVLRSKQASIEDFTKKWPSQTQLRTFLGQAQSPKEAENAYRALVILTERLIKLKNTPLSTAQQNYRSFYGQFKLTGQGLQTSSFEALKELNVGALTVNVGISSRLSAWKTLLTFPHRPPPIKLRASEGRRLRKRQSPRRASLPRHLHPVMPSRETWPMTQATTL